MYIPFICLSDNCEVTDISPTMKPFPDIKNGKGFLKRIFGDDISESVEELCRVGKKDGATLFELSQPFGIFGTLAVVRYSAGGVALYLLSEKDELEMLLRDRAKLGDGEKLPSVVKILSKADIPTDMSTFAVMCRRVSATITTYPVSTDDSFDGMLMPAGGAALLFICAALLRAVAGSADGCIEMSVDGTGMAFGLSISVAISSSVSFAGHGEELMTLAPHLKGSRAYLRCATVGARQAQLSLSAEMSDGKISFHIGNAITVFPPPEFKSPAREGLDAEIVLCDTVNFILSSVEALSGVQEK